MNEEHSAIMDCIVAIAIWSYCLQFCAIIAEFILPDGFEAGFGTIVTLLVSATVITRVFMGWWMKFLKGDVS